MAILDLGAVTLGSELHGSSGPQFKSKMNTRRRPTTNALLSEVAKSVFDAIVLKYRGNNSHILYWLLLSPNIISVSFNFYSYLMLLLHFILSHI
jgi:hypothetical protein